MSIHGSFHCPVIVVAETTHDHELLHVVRKLRIARANFLTVAAWSRLDQRYFSEIIIELRKKIIIELCKKNHYH